MQLGEALDCSFASGLKLGMRALNLGIATVQNEQLYLSHVHIMYCCLFDTIRLRARRNE